MSRRHLALSYVLGVMMKCSVHLFDCARRGFSSPTRPRGVSAASLLYITSVFTCAAIDVGSSSFEDAPHVPACPSTEYSSAHKQQKSAKTCVTHSGLCRTRQQSTFIISVRTTMSHFTYAPSTAHCAWDAVLLRLDSLLHDKMFFWSVAKSTHGDRPTCLQEVSHLTCQTCLVCITHSTVLQLRPSGAEKFLLYCSLEPGLCHLSPRKACSNRLPVHLLSEFWDSHLAVVLQAARS